jgi:hypothetical protein
LVPRLPSGGIAEFVTTEDLGVFVSGGTATVSVGTSGSFDCVYTVDEGVREVDIRITVCGVLVWAGVVRVCEITGHHLQSYDIAAEGRMFGCVVTPNGRYMAVSFYFDHKLHVYRLEDDGTTSLQHAVGATAGDGPMQFNYPGRMCLIPAGNLLVCEYGNDRVQELTGLGEAEPQHVRFILIAGAWSIALHGETLAVGTNGAIELLSYASGVLICSIGSRGSGPGQIGYRCEGLRFTPDGQLIVSAEQGNKRLSMFRVSDGSFVKHIGADVVADGWKDVQFAPSGELLAADCNNHRVCVFSADGDTLLRTWGTSGSADGQFKYPTALALVDSKLFVLDCDGGRVQVFE